MTRRAGRREAPAEPTLLGVGAVAADTAYAVIVVHGGEERSREPVHWLRPAVVRMAPFAWDLRRQLRAAKAPVLLLRNRLRGWNHPERDALRDGHWALDAVTARAPQARILLVGHSLGGRVVLRLLGDDRVHAVAALAPWVTPHDRPTGRPGQRVLLRHAAQDIITDPRETARMAHALRDRGVDVTLQLVHGDNHAMTGRAREWHTETGRFLLAALTASGDGNGTGPAGY